MILQALTAYYEVLSAAGQLSRPGWTPAKISYALELGSSGQLLSLLPLEVPQQRGKKEVMVPRVLPLPAAVKRTVGILPNFLWDNSAYLLGIDGKDAPERAAKCFAAAKALHLSLLRGLEDPFALAICAFFDRWDPAGALEAPPVAALGDALFGGNLVFYFDGHFASESPPLAEVWQQFYDQEDAADAAGMPCLVTGQHALPAATHPAVKGVRNAQPSGAALVSFNASSFCSYGREQNFNAPVSKYAAFAYTAALNHLLSHRVGDTLEFCRQIGDTAVLFWAEGGEAAYQDCFSNFLDGGGRCVSNEDLRAVMDRLSRGQSVSPGGIPLRPDNRFYVLGLAPNAARLSVRFFHQSTFGGLTKNLQAHYERIQMVSDGRSKWDAIPLWSLLDETVNQKGRDKSPSPQMAGDTLRSILTGGRYPATLYQQTQLRIRAERTVTRGRAAIIKAYLLQNREAERYKEALCVKLNEQTTAQPYVLGRIFSVLEAIQQTANPGIGATIKDKYFTAACATPATIFPILFNLSEKHLRKLDAGLRFYYETMQRELMAKISESYPTHHTLAEQGIFQLGYYHQTQKRYEKKDLTAAADSKKEEA